MVAMEIDPVTFKYGKANLERAGYTPNSLRSRVQSSPRRCWSRSPLAEGSLRR